VDGTNRRRALTSGCGTTRWIAVARKDERSMITKETVILDIWNIHRNAVLGFSVSFRVKRREKGELSKLIENVQGVLEGFQRIRHIALLQLQSSCFILQGRFQDVQVDDLHGVLSVISAEVEGMGNIFSMIDNIWD